MLPTINLKRFIPGVMTSKKAQQSSLERALRSQYVARAARSLASCGRYPVAKAQYFSRSNYRFWLWYSILHGDRIGLVRFLRLWLLLFAEIADDTTQGITFETEERKVLKLGRGRDG